MGCQISPSHTHTHLHAHHYRSCGEKITFLLWVYTLTEELKISLIFVITNQLTYRPGLNLLLPAQLNCHSATCMTSSSANHKPWWVTTPLFICNYTVCVCMCMYVCVCVLLQFTGKEEDGQKKRSDCARQISGGWASGALLGISAWEQDRRWTQSRLITGQQAVWGSSLSVWPIVPIERTRALVLFPLNWVTTF